MQLPIDFEGLIDEVNNANLYKKLIQQLNKDFLLANIDLDFHVDILPSSLKLILHETVYQLIQEKFSEYLNLLYIIDVPEKQVKDMDGDDVLKLSEDVSFLILKREWQKVWFKHKYSQKRKEAFKYKLRPCLAILFQSA
ncbi:hypothetical protein [Hyunsoonleella flava]|uniref:hypothetical protein n=1 Tax=Hyunsoonleella flava TaxID=2527939 RepID=UPI0026D46FBA